MIFNSIPFAVFLPIVFIIYWLIGGKRYQVQNGFLLLASYFFYGWWDWRFLSLLLGATFLSYLLGIGIGNAKREGQRKLLLGVGVGISLSLLVFFKYFDFFVESFADAFSLFGSKMSVVALNLILPLGISFYTFKILSYMLDVYKGRIPPCKNIFDYSLFVSFFPQLVAGPIERATTLLPQIQTQRKFSYDQAGDGMKLILWGLFKKIVVADTTAGYVHDIFSNHELYPASMLWLGILYFAFQVYADFSGYSDIAIGVGKLLGFELLKNFDRPFISKNITEFWRRWHISLSTWFNDYIFTPFYTTFRNWGNIAMYVGIMLTFFLSGLWHGESWHYIFFGALHGAAIVIETATKKSRKRLSKKVPAWLYNNLSMVLTFLFVIITWVFFRAKNMDHGFSYFKGLFDASIIEIPGKLAYIPLVLVMVIWEWLQRKKKHALDFGFARPLRWLIYLVVTFFILYYFGNEQQFFYFQF